MTALYYSHIESPVGSLLVAGDGEVLHLISFPTGRKVIGPHPEWRPCDAPFAEARRQLDSYFAGELRQFDLPLQLSGTTFQNRVWMYLSGIPFGETRSYGEIAEALGQPKASRAVGAANGSNPLPIVLPCHRVIGADGSMTGFGGGLATKAFLLRHEGALHLPDEQIELFEGQ
jgi:methylated-DNA-[protein]-cysteine S-methyltransferase